MKQNLNQLTIHCLKIGVDKVIIKSQTGKEHDIYEFSISGLNIFCKDNVDRRYKHLLGSYNSLERSTQVFQEIRHETSGYYEMPME